MEYESVATLRCYVDNTVRDNQYHYAHCRTGCEGIRYCRTHEFGLATEGRLKSRLYEAQQRDLRHYQHTKALHGGGDYWQAEWDWGY